VVRRMLKPQRLVHASRRIVAVEFSIPHGPEASYGLLGAEVVELEADGLEVVVSINSVGFPFRPSLALQPDEVRVGLLDEYAEAVLRGVERVSESTGLPAKGTLRFCWGAHGLVGSSASVFGRQFGVRQSSGAHRLGSDLANMESAESACP